MGSIAIDVFSQSKVKSLLRGLRLKLREKRLFATLVTEGFEAWGDPYGKQIVR